MADFYEHDDRTITVPKKPIEKWSGSYSAYKNPELFELYEFPTSEFWAAYSAGFFAKVNDRYGLMLDDFESGQINKDLEFVLNEAEQIRGECPTLYRAASAAVAYDSGIDFEL